ncbi:Putative toxin HigB2 [Oligella urethralis]|uniref:type II toxin-antitoxin system RelE/ParE family toxin n=1 Tax=Oligella urethralis TaxID=90245 RepID=UPI000DF92FC9|nr:type II toxin-antitoxin system RelE/ParE family toxin [Oligella urethralis]WOS38390.1 Putative toxin HigB2 [Oligella urethralis]SUA65955.1 Uncharacterized protein conserved in bacteria [Oligella urethralis]
MTTKQWTVLFTDRFSDWLNEQENGLRETVLIHLLNLEKYGFLLARPYADTIKDSTYPNMKELRVQYRGCPIRVFYAFDPLRQAIVLCAGDKTGKEKQFYKKMIRIADQEFKNYLESLRGI